MVGANHLHMPSYFFMTFTEYPKLRGYLFSNSPLIRDIIIVKSFYSETSLSSLLFLPFISM